MTKSINNSLLNTSHDYKLVENYFYSSLHGNGLGLAKVRDFAGATVVGQIHNTHRAIFTVGQDDFVAAPLDADALAVRAFEAYQAHKSLFVLLVGGDGHIAIAKTNDDARLKGMVPDAFDAYMTSTGTGMLSALPVGVTPYVLSL